MKNSNSNSNSFLSIPIPIPIPFYQFITLEGPEDRHLRNSSRGGHVTSLTLQYLWPRPPGVWLGGPGLIIVSISSRWLMDIVACLPDDLWYYPI